MRPERFTASLFSSYDDLLIFGESLISASGDALAADRVSGPERPHPAIPSPRRTAFHPELPVAMWPQNGGIGDVRGWRGAEPERLVSDRSTDLGRGVRGKVLGQAPTTGFSSLTGPCWRVRHRQPCAERRPRDPREKAPIAGGSGVVSHNRSHYHSKWSYSRRPIRRPSKLCASRSARSGA